MGFYPGLDITGKTVLITGGTSGIGRAIALGFAQAGAKVVAGSTNPDKVAAIKKELDAIGGGGGGHDAVAMDVTSEESVKAAVDFAAKKLGRIDACVHSAGINKKQPSFDTSVEDFRRINDINLTGTFIVNKAVGVVMKAQPADKIGQRGNIVNIASLTSFMSLVEVLPYAAGKTGVLGIIRGLANEWAQFGIRVNGIAPGVFPTDLNRKFIEGTPRGTGLISHTPMNRFGKVEELVGAAVYLISDSASFTTGHTIVVDGGFLTRGVGC
jgi:NAD(P)-dependent dehydrogenase (short-subunit alcohol dehydrogenase family)